MILIIKKYCSSQKLLTCHNQAFLCNFSFIPELKQNWPQVPSKFQFSAFFSMTYKTKCKLIQFCMDKFIRNWSNESLNVMNFNYSLDKIAFGNGCYYRHVCLFRAIGMSEIRGAGRSGLDQMINSDLTTLFASFGLDFLMPASSFKPNNF